MILTGDKHFHKLAFTTPRILTARAFLDTCRPDWPTADLHDLTLSVNDGAVTTTTGRSRSSPLPMQPDSAAVVLRDDLRGVDDTTVLRVATEEERIVVTEDVTTF